MKKSLIQKTKVTFLMMFIIFITIQTAIAAESNLSQIEFKHNPILEAYKGEDLTIKANVIRVHNLREITLYYRPKNDYKQYLPLQMKADATGYFLVVIPGDQITQSGLEYYITAVDHQGIVHMLFKNPKEPQSVFSRSLKEELDAVSEILEDEFAVFAAEDFGETMVTVASLFEESELTVGSSVAAVSEKEWKLKGYRRASDAISHISSIMMLPTFGGANAISIRGYSNELSVRGIATLLDGIPVNTLTWGTAQYNLPNVDLGILDKIEIIKGPGSAIYGSDAFHGVYSLNTFQSEKDIFAAEYGNSSLGLSMGSLKTSYAVNDETRLSLAASYSRQNEMGIEYNYTDPESLVKNKGQYEKFYESQSAVLKLNHKHSKMISFDANVYYNRWNGQKFSGVGTHFTGGSSLNLGNDHSNGFNTFTMGKGKTTISLANKIDIELAAYYWESNQELTYDLSSSSNFFIFQGQKEYKTGFSVIAKQPENALNTQWVLSYGMNQMKIFDTFYDILPVNGVRIESKAEYNKLERSIHNFFFQSKTSFLNKMFYAIIGIRGDIYSDFGFQTTPRGGIIFMPNEDMSLKMLYGNAFRASVGGEIAGASNIKGNPDIKPETINTYELSCLWNHKNYKFGITGFMSFWKDGIVAEPLAEPDEDDNTAEYMNRGKNESTGLELSFSYFSETLSFEFDGSYIESENTTDSKKPVEYAVFPKYILNSTIGYHIKSLNSHFNIINRAHIDTKTEPHKAFFILKPKDLKNYYRTDLSLLKDLEQFQMILNVKNIFNRENYLPSIWSSEGGIPEAGISTMLLISYKLDKK